MLLSARSLTDTPERLQSESSATVWSRVAVGESIGAEARPREPRGEFMRPSHVSDPSDWRLRRRVRLAGGEVAFDVFGAGAGLAPPSPDACTICFQTRTWC